MKQDKLKHPTLEELTSPGSGDPEPGYDAWMKAKVEKALEESKDRTRMTPAREVWAKFGFED